MFSPMVSDKDRKKSVMEPSFTTIAEYFLSFNLLMVINYIINTLAIRSIGDCLFDILRQETNCAAGTAKMPHYSIHYSIKNRAVESLVFIVVNYKIGSYKKN